MHDSGIIDVPASAKYYNRFRATRQNDSVAPGVIGDFKRVTSHLDEEGRVRRRVFRVFDLENIA